MCGPLPRVYGAVLLSVAGAPIALLLVRDFSARRRARPPGVTRR